MSKRLIVTLLIIFCVLNIGLGSYGLSETSEARYAEISREMAENGDYLNPTKLGIKHFHKPPLTYYITALGYKMFGTNEFGARFFLGIALIIQLILIYKIGNRLFKNKEIAYASTLIYFSFPIVLISIRNLTTDAYLTTFFLLSIYSWLEYVAENKKIYLYAGCCFLGLGFLTKGPVVLLPFISFVIIYNILLKKGFRITLHHILGTFLFLIISSSWFVAVIHANPQLWDYFIDRQLIDRTVNAKSFHRDEPWWYYFLLAPAIGLPWVALICLKLIKKKKLIKQDVGLKLLVLTILINLLIFSFFSSKLVLYILPLYPFLALLGGYLFIKISKNWMRIFNGIIYALIGLLILGIMITGFLGIFAISYISMLTIIIILALAVFLITKFDASESIKLLFPGFLFSCTLLISFSIFASSNPSVINSVKEPVSFINTTKPSLQRLFIYDKLIPSAAFYTDAQIVTVAEQDYKTFRNLSFESDEDYKKSYYDLRIDGEFRRFSQALTIKNSAVLIKKTKVLNDSLQEILDWYNHEKDFNEWRIYY
ncbi:glycosyltransferase family 39 protein [Gramella sp. AN32]|uniref:ArnT family glycosyltransferase n=1 Tax=Christiangramia antarctica TaxID=2058158 RepID=A0ABW5X694_9FLAO|nr:glycosyltransferase family 39 protein [Gramella sp. AN32]MCM4156135.1 UDP-phosphate alpha-4-amino-4-deoxy-L-arabinose arabinosyl transferase [Gramella sp. AN32]